MLIYVDGYFIVTPQKYHLCHQIAGLRAWRAQTVGEKAVSGDEAGRRFERSGQAFLMSGLVLPPYNDYIGALFIERYGT
jgi:hypothetical protein